MAHDRPTRDAADALLLDGSRSIAGLSRMTGVPERTLRRWRSELPASPAVSSEPTQPDAAASVVGSSLTAQEAEIRPPVPGLGSTGFEPVAEQSFDEMLRGAVARARGAEVAA